MQCNDLKTRGLIEVITLTHQLAEPWELGRLAALAHGVMSDNPFQAETVPHHEWARGFVFGAQLVAGEVEVIVLEGVAETLPVIESEILPERAFWASAKLLQCSRQLSDEQLAARIGVGVTLLQEAMQFHHLCDVENIELARVAG